MASRGWIIPFPEGYHGRDNRPWYGLVPCHDDCDEWSVVRRMTNKVWYAGCETKHPPIRLGGCKSRYEWGSHREMPAQTLTTLKSHLAAIQDMPIEYQRVLADAWGLTIEQLTTGDFDHGTADETDEDDSAQTSNQATGEETAPEVSEGPDAADASAESPGGSEGGNPEGPGDTGGDGGNSGEEVTRSGGGIPGGDDGQVDDAEDTPAPDLPELVEPDAGPGPETGPDTEPGTGPGDGVVWDQCKRLFGGSY